tara:strand:+ start:1461 stop:1778 length:318 start_codon:yes stop_codon:yes gene_type:complete
MKKITLTETQLTRIIKKVIEEQSTGGVVTHQMIQGCKSILNNVPGTTAQWKQNFKQTALGKPCNWVMNRYQHFANKMQTTTFPSSAYHRASAKSGFCECLVGQCQ